MNKSILIIDDDLELRRSLKIGLEREKFAVIQAESAEAAAEILKRVSVDGIILDRMMSGADGLSFLRALRKSGDKTPVLMLTAIGGGENAADGLFGGANDYLAKPFHFRELLLRLGNMLKKNSAPDESGAARMPANLSFSNGEFFARKKNLPLSDSEKTALSEMLGGGTARMPPMAAKRLREKLNLANLENIDIITARGKGYKIVMSYEV